ncbi:MAG: hypothetical protein IPP46_08595 [Bacteroidetes bacterium]|nr:hypothetical protein [Bacteroidota bacterium]
MKNTITTSLLVLLCTFIFTSCKKDEEEERKANKDLYCDINSGGATYYVGTQVITEGLGGAHGFIKVRYNNIAASALDSTGKLPVGGTFPNGSVVVKEIYSSLSGGLNLYAIMKKKQATRTPVQDGYGVNISPEVKWFSVPQKREMDVSLVIAFLIIRI